MKTYALLMTFIISTAAMAKMPATAAFNKLMNSGTYQGVNEDGKCWVSVEIKSNTVELSIKSGENKDFFTVFDTAANYSVNESTLEMKSSINLNYPRYVGGGTKILNVKPNANAETAFAISNILVDHNDNDFSTYFECKIQFN